MNEITQIHTNDHKLARLTKGLTLVNVGVCHQYWAGADLKYIIIFDNKLCVYNAYQVVRCTKQEN